MKFYDVSVPISDELPVWPGDPGISMELTCSLARGDSANVTQLEMGVHTGTHIDAPSHFEPGGKTIDQLPMEILTGTCRVVEIPHSTESIGPAELEKLDLSGVIRILFKTKNSKFWAREEKKFQKKFVHLSKEGASFLVEHGIKLVGIDYLSVEQFASPDHATHHILLRNQVIIVEGLNLSGISEGEYELIALPIKLKGADGAPARVILREKAPPDM
ncbi:MAG: cyclase family protein [Nitrospina sp.]|jgi:arylformamidase|nr:cyclase family protein [Nitrospina sp.]MBT6716876.1 cyclase family protein [Nitrospina sp.]